MSEPSLIKKKFDDNNPKVSIAITVLVVIVASTLISISTAIFLNPLGLYAGGVTGIAQIVLHLMGIIAKNDWQAYDHLLGIMNFIFLFPFNILAFFKLSKKYAIYTTLSSIVQTIALEFQDFFIGLKIFYTDGAYEVLTCTLVAAAISGLANGLLMRRGATSGGIITLCQYLNLKKGKSVGSINLIMCSIIMVCGALVSIFAQNSDVINYGSAISIALYTLVFFVLSSLVLDYVHTAYNKVKLEVVTEGGKGAEMAKELINLFPHGVTLEKGVGAYSMKEKDIVVIIIQKYELNKYKDLIHKVDPSAFISYIPVAGLSGRFNVQVIDK